MFRVVDGMDCYQQQIVMSVTKMIKQRKSYGGVLIEAALVLPIFIAVIFAFIWAGYYFNAKTSLSSTLIRSLRTSVTRGNFALGEGTIQDIEDWYTFGGAPSARLDSLLRSSDITWNTAKSFYDNEATEVVRTTINTFGPVIPNPIMPDYVPRSYVYTYVMLYEGFRQSVGKSLRYPCNPDLPGGDRCLMCVLVHPDPALRNPRASFAEAFTVQGTTFDTYPSSTGLGLRCRYKPNAFMLRPVMNMLNIMTGGTLNDIGVIDITAWFGNI